MDYLRKIEEQEEIVLNLNLGKFELKGVSKKELDDYLEKAIEKATSLTVKEILNLIKERCV